MTIEDKIAILDMKISFITFIFNSRYGIHGDSIFEKIIDRYKFKVQKNNLLKQLERREKLKKINDGR
jgi:hypothetical protein